MKIVMMMMMTLITVTMSVATITYINEQIVPQINAIKC